MKEKIKQIVRNLKIAYAGLWGIALLLFILGETGVLPVGMLADNVRSTYLFETACILITAICVPLSLKLYNIVLARKIDKLELTSALTQYILWSNIRIILLEIVVITNLICYYMTLSNTGALCALIGLTASLFCLPGERRLYNELHITKEE